MKRKCPLCGDLIEESSYCSIVITMASHLGHCKENYPMRECMQKNAILFREVKRLNKKINDAYKAMHSEPRILTLEEIDTLEE